MKVFKSVLLLAASLSVFCTACGNSAEKPDYEDYESSYSYTDNFSGIDLQYDEESEKISPVEEVTEEMTEHISPIETFSAECSTQQTINKSISKDEGSNTIKLPLSDFIEDGDIIKSFTFVIYSSDNADIGEFKGGCGISVSGECPSATDEGWYQSKDFTAPTQGTYGEITWNVPAEIAEYIASGGEILFGYWWGGSAGIRIENVICTYTRTKDIPVDGTETKNIAQTVSYKDADNVIKVKTADFLPENAVPQAVTFNVSSGGTLGKFTGAFGYESSAGNYQSADTAFFTSSSSLSLTWFVPQEAKSLASDDGAVTFGYWWSSQPNVTLDSITVKYSLGNTSQTETIQSEKIYEEYEGDFMTSQQIVNDIKVGWNLGNSLESYNTGKTGLSTETGWGNVKTTREIIDSVKNAGFNAIRIPVTWGEHMDGNVIQEEWLDRVEEIVDYAYCDNMYIIINMHHDDYIWFKPQESEYESCREKFCAIWQQISERFADYGDHLIFEGMNEPRTVGSNNEWTGGTPEERAIVNKYNQDFVDTVRSTGGKNTVRTLIVTTYGASAENSAINDVVIPKGKNIVLNLHYYAPWKFADGSSTVFGDIEKNELNTKFIQLKNQFIDNGTPVIIDEFGCVAVADDETRAAYFEYYLSYAKMNGIKCFVWDNGVSIGKSSFGIVKRGSLQWNETLLESIMKGSEK
ncbi:MAG: cellulase family glycosylhydrolase [Ruminococcus sp.]|nr:cellulase family glycosylhydrolase [Ruminococcus sp.]